MSTSLIGRLGSSAFRLSTAAGVDVAHGLVLLFGIGTRALVWGFLCQGISQGRASFSFVLRARRHAQCGRDDDQRRARFRGAVQSRHNLVSGRSKDPNHDAVMRIGSEAPKRRTHSSIRRESQGASRDSATSNRDRRPATSVRTSRNCRGAFSALRSLCRTQNNAIRDNALPHEPPQGDQ
jgi:hypothetical protein